MAPVWISCFIVLCVIVSDGAKTISGKAYYCRDPDTGKLHDVNTTWPSTTFCGSYICKIRKKNLTNAGIPPLRQLNITSSNNKFILTFNSTIENVSQARPISDSFRVSDKQRNISKNAKEIQDLVREKMGHINEQLRQGDRYLTEDEIKAFTEILRFMKKSDLEALLEIYSLAQDIYKEIDKATDENIIEETLRDLKENNISDNMEKAINKSTSYWYEPLAVMSNKHRLNENDLSKDSELMQNVLENFTQGRNNVVAIIKPKETTIRTPPLLTPKPKTEPNRSVFFKGTLSEDDFGKLPYFYPMSSFQRLSSYINPFIQNSIQSQQKVYSDVQIPQMIQVIPPWYKPYMVPYQTKPLPDMTYNKKVTEAKNVAKTQKVAAPMQIYQNNLTETENSYFNAYPWSLYNLYPPIKKQIPQQLPYVNTGYLSYQPNTLLMSSEIVDQKQDKEVNAMVVPEKKLPDWQTEPLPNSVLDEVRANILMKSKLIPLRKKMRLERVGKVIKLEDIRKDRAKREADDFDEYEAYVEKYTCGSDTEPGFFRMGNTTEPYPACCPQRIGKGS